MNTSSLSRFPSDGRFLPPVVGHSLGDISGAVFHDSANERARAIRNATAPTIAIDAAAARSSNAAPSLLQYSSGRGWLRLQRGDQLVAGYHESPHARVLRCGGGQPIFDA